MTEPIRAIPLQPFFEGYEPDDFYGSSPNLHVAVSAEVFQPNVPVKLYTERIDKGIMYQIFPPERLNRYPYHVNPLAFTSGFGLLGRISVGKAALNNEKVDSGITDKFTVTSIDVYCRQLVPGHLITPDGTRLQERTDKEYEEELARRAEHNI
ncbi:MAG: hypothetical protein ACR2LN_00455 [Candidatus Levyibacteriota bacterium]